jgi:Ca2+-binding EF-hand superfamily protein
MLKPRKAFLAIVLLVAPIGAIPQKAAAPQPKDKLALAQNEAEQLLLLMDTDKTGKVTKQQWMRMMEAEFDRLDKTKAGAIDVKEIERSRSKRNTYASLGK